VGFESRVGDAPAFVLGGGEERDKFLAELVVGIARIAMIGGLLGGYGRRSGAFGDAAGYDGARALGSAYA